MTGKFLPGNRCAAGKNAAQRIRHFRKVLLDALTDEQIREALGKAMELVRQGNVAAIRLVLEYGCGSPSQTLELTGADGEPLGLSMAHITEAISAALVQYPEAQLTVALAIQGMLSSRGADDSRHDHRDERSGNPAGILDGLPALDDAQPGDDA